VELFIYFYLENSNLKPIIIQQRDIYGETLSPILEAFQKTPLNPVLVEKKEGNL
jgi:hypothetical protein